MAKKAKEKQAHWGKSVGVGKQTTWKRWAFGIQTRGTGIDFPEICQRQVLRNTDPAHCRRKTKIRGNAWVLQYEQCVFSRRNIAVELYQRKAKQDDLALIISTALHTIEKDNKSLKGALPDNYFSRLGLESSKLASLIDEISEINTLKDKEQDIIGRVYEYFLSKFALAEGKGKANFTPQKAL